MNSYIICRNIHEFIIYMNSCIIQNDLSTHLVLEFELTPIPFLMELFIDSTGDVVIASNDMEVVFRT
jgi:hypothetical protein